MCVKLFRSGARTFVLSCAMLLVFWMCLLLGCVESTHIFTIDEDFSKLKTDPALEKHVEQVLKKLRTFKVAVHPRIRLFYLLLKSGMADHAHRTADSLYTPYVYKEQDDNHEMK